MNNSYTNCCGTSEKTCFLAVTEKVWESESATDVSDDESGTAETSSPGRLSLTGRKVEQVSSKASPVSIKKEKKKQASLFMFVKK